MADTINIAIAADAGYLVHARVMLYSLYDSNKKNRFCIYLFTEAKDHPELKKIQQLTQQNENTVVVVPVNTELFEKFPVGGHITVASYYRLLIPELIPESIDKLIYLDIDILVKTNIRPLWETSLGDNCVAAVDEQHEAHARRLNLPDNKYFNAGVLVINTNVWRHLEITEKGLEVAAKRGDTLIAYDQDILNILLVDKWLSLPTKWNQMEGHRLGYMDQEPAIVHFLGFKPWSIHCIHPMKKEYYRYYYKMEGPGKKIGDTCRRLVQALRNRIAFYSKTFTN
jgi:lipopolysaccharide biosynthesis glycosyltransferase